MTTSSNRNSQLEPQPQPAEPSAKPPARPPAGTAAPPRFRRLAAMLLLAVLLAWMSLVFWNSAKPLPPGIHVVSQTSRLSEADVDFLYEPAQSASEPLTSEPLTSEPHASAQHTDSPARDLSAIDRAEQLIVLDRSPVSDGLARHLLARKRQRPNLKVVLVTDPCNPAFGGTPAQTLVSLEAAGIIVARVRLDRLRDSNPLYSGLWRLLFGWWSDPFDETSGPPTLAAWARLQNFKADQRQLTIADDGSGGWTAVLGPAGAAAELVLRGSLARAMLGSELQIAAWSTDDDRLPPVPPMGGRGVGSIDARFLTEGAVETALLDALAAAGRDDRISIAVQNLSERPLIAAMQSAAARGAHLQVLLARNPMPNQAVAGELRREGGGGIEVRWYPGATGAQGPKLLLVRHRTDVWMNWGSANFTRRNLADLNLEAGVELRMPAQSAPARAASDYFAGAWSKAAAAADDGSDAGEPAGPYWRYRFAEATGLSSF